MVDLRIALIQSKLHWEDKAANRTMFQDKILSFEQQADLIVLPEMFTTGFSMKPENLAETMSGESITWMKTMASSTGSVLVGSIIIEEYSKYYNRLIWMKPDQTFECYDKRHLFRLANEQNIYTAGQTKKIVEYKGWKINLNICYDMRFPVWSRNQNDYDILLNVANWPAKRSYPWKTLMRARAIENMSYVVALNRVGDDGNGYPHTGDSAIIKADGKAIIEQANEEKVLWGELSMSELKSFRERFQFYKDADDFEITN